MELGVRQFRRILALSMELGNSSVLIIHDGEWSAKFAVNKVYQDSDIKYAHADSQFT